MKHYLLALLFSASMSTVRGQTLEPLKIPDSGITTLSRGGTVIPSEKFVLTSGMVIYGHPKLDTVPAIMLCTDTANYPHGVSIGFDEAMRANGYSFQIKGFLVWMTDERHFYHDPIYLNADKKPLPKTIVVWLTK